MTFPCLNHQSKNSRNFLKASGDSATDCCDLVAGLLEELGETLGLIMKSTRRGDDMQVFHHQASADFLLSGLDKELNFELAGDLSQTLRLIYEEAAKRIRLEEMEAYVERIGSAREMILEIEKAWTEIVAVG